MKLLIELLCMKETVLLQDKVKLCAVSLVGGTLGILLNQRLGFLSQWDRDASQISVILILAITLFYCLLNALLHSYMSLKRAIEISLGCWFLTIGLSVYLKIEGLHFPLGLSGNIFFWSALGCILLKHKIEKTKKDSILKVFKSYVSPELVEIISKDPEKFNLKGEEREITILFSDLQGFTTLAERLPAAELVNVMNQYFTGMSSVIFKHGGTIDKFIGDAVMAFWNAPVKSDAHASMCLKCSLEITKFSDDFFKERKGICDQIGFMPKTKIGINTGTAIVGNIGSSERLTYTAMGDQINLAARLEGLNGSYGTNILISLSTYELLRKTSLSDEGVQFHFIDRVLVKGKSQQTAVFTLSLNDPKYSDLLYEYQASWTDYSNRKFDLAISGFSKLLQAYPENSTLLNLMIDRCHSFKLTPPPPDWAGEYIFKNK